MKLYQLPAAFAEVEAMTTEDGELTPEAMERLASIEGEMESKVDAICRVVRHFEAHAAAYEQEAKRLRRHQEIAENNARRLKEYMRTTLETMGIAKVETDLFKVRVQASPMSVHVSGLPKELPEEFQVWKCEADKRALLESFKLGQELPDGVTVSQSTHLRIS